MCECVFSCCWLGQFHRLRGTPVVGDVGRAGVPRLSGDTRLARVQPRVVRVAHCQTSDQRSGRRGRLRRRGQHLVVYIVRPV